jgi:hypothetical protein
MQLRVHIRCNADLATVISAMFKDELAEAVRARSCEPRLSKTFLDRNPILRELHKIVVARLFGPGAWPAKDEEIGFLNEKLLELGLFETVPGDPDMVQESHLGEDLQLDVLMAFLGMYYEIDILPSLGDLCDEELEAYFWKHIKDDDVLRIVTRCAYQQYLKTNHVRRNANALLPSAA